MCRVERICRCVVLLLGIVVALPTTAHAQLRLHGGSLQKACVGPAVCEIDPFAAHKARRGDTITCTLRVSNLDSFGDQLRVDSIIDVVHHGPPVGDRSSGNLLLSPPVVLAPQDTPGDQVEVAHTDTVEAGDGPTLNDSGQANGADLGFSPNPLPFSFPAVGMVDVVECCVDTDCDDQNVCTIDSCNLTTNTCVHTPGNAGTECRPSAGQCDVAELCTGDTPTCPPDGFVSSGVVCRAAAGPCDQPEACTGSSADCPADKLQPSGFVCREAVGLCDLAEICSGTSVTCPADVKRASGFVCRASAGVCDPQEVCDGVSGVCPADVKSPSGTVCRVSTGVCDPQEVCDGQSTTCPSDTKSPSGTVCRASAGVCDPQEVCDGVSGACPADAKSASGTVCRASAGVCDPQEVCNGTSNTCPADAKSASGTVCRASAGVCDPQEVCDGQGNTCPADAKSASGTVCRASAGACDPQEVCDGQGNTCPTDVKSPSGTVCRASAGVCDPQEVCDGTSNACPTDAKSASGTVCRASAGVCDPQEVCDGTSNTCPADAKSASGTVCRAAVGPCDVAEVCDGQGNACPADGFASSSTVCRAAAGICDQDELCPGNGPNCPSDAKKASGTVCRASAGVCDPQEVCDGTTNGCPADAKSPSGTVCRASAGVCDPQEVCDGTSNACPTDAKSPSGTVCRASAGVCDPQEVCDGTSSTCPADAKSPSGTVCRASSGVCDMTEVCDGSSNNCPTDVFVPSGTLCRAAAGECDVSESCSGTSANCPSDVKKTNGTACTDDGNVCTLDRCDGTSDTCQHPAGNAGTVCRAAAGVCDVPETCTGTSTSCPADSKSPSGTVCRASAGVCDPQEVCDGTSSACPADAKSASGTVCRESTGACDPAEMCDGTSGTCPTDKKSPSGTVCRASTGVCDPAEVCDGQSGSCPADVKSASGTVCRASAGVCDVQEVCDGTSNGCPSDAKAPSGTTCRAPGTPCDGICDGTGNNCPSECPDAGILLTTTTPSINPGDTATYVIQVTGNGPGPSTGVVVTDILPPGLTWVPGGPDGGSCAVVAGTLTCTFPTLPQGATKQVTVSAVTTAANCGTMQTTATLTADLDTNPANNSSGPVSITVNCGPNCCQARPSSDSLWPPNHKFESVDVLGVTSPSGGPVTITITGIFQDEPLNSLGDGSTQIDGLGVGTSTAQVRHERTGNVHIGNKNGRVYFIGFSATDAQGGMCTGVVLTGVPHDQGGRPIPIPDAPLFDSTDGLSAPLPFVPTTSFPCPELPDASVTLTTSTPVVVAGDVAVFDMVVSANGPGNSTGVVLTNDLPDGLVWTVGGPDQAFCTIDPGTELLTCSFGTLTPGSTRTVSVSAITNPGNCMDGLTSSANVHSDLDRVPANDMSGPLTISVLCPGAPDVGVLLTTPTSTINAGDNAIYDIDVAAGGPGASTGVVLSDTLPPGLPWVVGGSDGGSCGILAGVLTCNFPTVPEGTIKHVTLTAVTSVENCGSLQNTATVTADADANPANNSSGPVGITVNCGVDCSHAAPTSDSLWPPNHKFVSVDVLGVTSLAGGPVSITITGIFQDEPLNSLGDGNTPIDGKGVGTSTAHVRRERTGNVHIGNKNGRVYFIGFKGTDSRGAMCTGVVLTGVPHDQGGRPIPIPDAILYDSTGGLSAPLPPSPFTTTAVGTAFSSGLAPAAESQAVQRHKRKIRRHRRA